MRYYLDTNILIFILSNDKDEFSTQVLDVLEDYSNMFYLSAVVLKELLNPFPIKFRLFLLTGSLSFTKVKVCNSYLTNDNVFDNEKTNFAFNGNDFHNRFFVGMYQSFSG